MNLTDKQKKEKWILIGLVFTLYFVVTGYKLTNSSLWFDEAIEYFFSKNMFGTIPEIGNYTTSMYQRIISTYQPPLYNIVMWIWLRVNDGEWWFRFSGVVFGFIGAIGVYKSTNKLSNYRVASLSVVVYSTVYQLIYYIQECAEYSLMLGLLCWTVYFYLEFTINYNRKNLIFFVIFCILPVYSQYGAMFPVAIFIAGAFISVLLSKDIKKIKEVIVAYLIAFFGAVVPLYIFFMKVQMSHQVGYTSPSNGTSNFIYDLFNNIFNVFSWNMIAKVNESGEIAVWCSIFVLLIINTICLVKSKNTMVKNLVLCNLVIWLFYYISVSIGVYAYGDFANRYNLFFIPIWIISIIVVINEFFVILKDYGHKFDQLRYFLLGIILIITICYCNNGWSVIKENWQKENLRAVIEQWYEQDGNNENTIVYYASQPAFAFYSQKYKPENLGEKIIFQEWLRSKSEEEYREYFNNIFNSNMPSSLYFIASHYREDLVTMINSFTNLGYKNEVLFDEDGAKLLYFYK